MFPTEDERKIYRNSKIKDIVRIIIFFIITIASITASIWLVYKTLTEWITI